MAKTPYKSDASNLHAGHRARMKKRFITEGLDGFSDVQVLELLLFYCMPQGDTNEIAHRLINKFGSVSGVLDASPSQLIECEGIGEHTATFITALPALCRRYRMDKICTDNVFESKNKIERYLIACYMQARSEYTVVLCLDNNRRLVNTVTLHEGSQTYNTSNTHRIAEIAMANNVRHIVLAHNHPSGICEPSEEDILSAGEMRVALELVGINLVEHYIITSEQACGILEYTNEHGISYDTDGQM